VNQLLERLKVDFQSEDARYAYADAVINAFVSAQIKALREDRELSQEDLAELIGTKQSGISRLEKTDYSSWKIETLRRLARAFGVRLRISFEEFGTLANDVAGFNESNLLPQKFENDPAFKKISATRPRSKARPKIRSRMERGRLRQKGRAQGAAPRKRL
jgi:transcriptional regulator with XRE-family HTH domain